jgi:glycosyltransferase involved in cell wall biosynthesis
MRIGIDGGCWGNRRGYGRFLREILAALSRRDKQNEYVIFLDSFAYQSFRMEGPFRPVRVELSRPVAEAASSEGRRSVPDLLRMARALGREPLDLIFFPSVYSYFPVLSRRPVIVCIHDTIPERDPKLHFASWRQAAFWRAKVRLALTQATLVLTVSEYSKRCLAEVLRVPESKIRVVYEAASPVFRQLEPAVAKEPFLLYVGGFNPHKNLDTLVRAFARLAPHRPDLKLLLAGNHSSDVFKGMAGALAQQAARLGLAERVVFTGYVPDEELCRLYNRAALVVLPSFEEGFGLPALEAMACGTAIVATAGHAVEEVATGAGIFVDATSEEALAEAIENLLSDPERARRLGERGRERAAGFSWDRAAERLLQIFEEAVGY